MMNFNTHGLSLKFCTSLTSLAILAGCTAGPNYERPNDPLPATYTTEPTEPATIAVDTELGEAQRFIYECGLPEQWWELFHSDALNELVEASLENSPTVEAAQAALSVAVENVYAQKGFYYPSVNADFTPTRQKSSEDLATNVASGAFYYALYTAQVSVSYTADVFGANRRQVESLQAQADSQSFMLEATYLTLTSNVVNAAIQEAGLRAQIDATKKIIDIQNKSMDTFQRMYELGQVSQADIAAQEASLAAAEAALPVLKKQLAIQRDLIKTLAGRFPSDMETATFDLDSFLLPTELPLSLPSALVEHRPDVRAAEEQLHAASAAIGVAAANRLPTITLGVDTYGWAATEWDRLFRSSTSFWELAGGLAQPIFSGGTLEHKELAAKAAYYQAAAQYRATVLNAFQNVADSLQAIHWDALALRAADKAERAASKSLEIVRKQLGEGDVSMLVLLTAEQTYHQALLTLVQARTSRLADTVALFQALGGGWWNKECPE